MTVSDRIRHYRKEQGYSQTDLANLADINIKSLSRYEIGTSIPPADVLKKIADALKISADILLSDDAVAIKDKALFERFEVIQEMTGDAKEMIMVFLDMAVRDYKAKQAYSS